MRAGDHQPGIGDDRPVRRHDEGVDLELAKLRADAGQHAVGPGDGDEQSGHDVAIDRRPAAVSVEEDVGAKAAQHFERASVIDGREPERDVVEQFGQRAARADDDGGTELVGGGADDQLEPCFGLLFHVERRGRQTVARQVGDHRRGGRGQRVVVEAQPHRADVGLVHDARAECLQHQRRPQVGRSIDECAGIGRDRAGRNRSLPRARNSCLTNGSGMTRRSPSSIGKRVR